ncbi:MAG: sugar nucleotide-binding protein, partial [Anaerolineales bacterium]|nr:sugar nucleotide-binding protein [Anaerolineales bacterium]
MTRLLITGGSSYLGQHLVPIANKSFDVVYTTFQNNPLQLSSGVQLDLRDETAVLRLVAQVKPDIIIHLVGSNRPQDMADVIRRGTQAITKAAVQQQARLIHLSTDSIFNGENAPYGETAVPTPINTYGRAKADAETIAAQHPNYAIVRTSLIYGLEIMDHGTSWMVKALQA